MLLIALSSLVTILPACGPAHGPPKVILAPPNDLPAEWQGRRLFNTPAAYIYAHSPESAGEADRWVAEVADYIRRTYQRELEKGIVLVSEPSDPPLARSIEESHLYENDPDLLITKPRKPSSPAAIREKMQAEGIPEEHVARAASFPLSSDRLRQMDLPMGSAAWAVAAPSHDLAAKSGVEVMAAALHKKNPRVSEAQARDAVARNPDLAARPFEISRGNPVFIMWAQRRADWSDDQRRREILRFLKNVLRKNRLPVPEDHELGW